MLVIGPVTLTEGTLAVPRSDEYCGVLHSLYIDTRAGLRSVLNA